MKHSNCRITRGIVLLAGFGACSVFVHGPRQLTLLLHGGRKAFFHGSVAQLHRGDPGTRSEQCEVLGFDKDAKCWEVRSAEPHHQDKQTQIGAGALTFDHYVACAEDESLSGCEASFGVQISDAGATGESLISRGGAKRGEEIFAESPFMVASNVGSEPWKARWCAYAHALRSPSKHGPVLSAFSRLSHGGLTDRCKEKAAQLRDGFSSTDQQRISAQDVAEVLARWDSNTQRLPVPSASGLFRYHSKLQHSCRPNCAVGVSYSTGEVVVRAIRNIGVGEQLTRNYESEPFLNLDVSARLAHLQETRGFACACERCHVESKQLCDIVETVMALEEAFDVELPDEETTSLKNVGDVADLIQGKL